MLVRLQERMDSSFMSLIIHHFSVRKFSRFFIQIQSLASKFKPTGKVLNMKIQIIMYKLICIQRNSRFEEKSNSSSVIQNEQTECEFMVWPTGTVTGSRYGVTLRDHAHRRLLVRRKSKCPDFFFQNFYSRLTMCLQLDQ